MDFRTLIRRDSVTDLSTGQVFGDLRNQIQSAIGTAIAPFSQQPVDVSKVHSTADRVYLKWIDDDGREVIQVSENVRFFHKPKGLR